jgi:hypothetical protein
VTRDFSGQVLTPTAATIQIGQFGTPPTASARCLSPLHSGGSGSPRLLRSLIPGASIWFVRVRSYDRPGRSIVTVLLETSM